MLLFLSLIWDINQNNEPVFTLIWILDNSPNAFRDTQFLICYLPLTCSTLKTFLHYSLLNNPTSQKITSLLKMKWFTDWRFLVCGVCAHISASVTLYLIFFWARIFPWTQSSLFWLGWLASKPLGSTCLGPMMFGWWAHMVMSGSVWVLRIWTQVFLFPQ